MPENSKNNVIKEIEREDKIDEIEEMQEIANDPNNKKTWINYIWSSIILVSCVVVPLVIQKYFIEEKFKRFIRKPLVKDLLPEQIVPPGYPKDLLPKTLVIGFEGVLADLQQDTDKNMYKFKKRPYFDYFISKIKGNYEIVLLSAQDSMSMMMLAPKIDPRQEFLQQFYGFEVFGKNTPKSSFKQLDCLNRELRNVICIDFEKTSIESFEENCCLIKEYKSDDHDEEDKTLMQLGLFLENLAKTKVDIREHLAKWGNLNAVENYKDSLDLKINKMKERKSSLFGGQKNKNKDIK